MAGTDYSLRIVINADDRASAALRGLRGALGELGGGLRTVGVAALEGLGALAGAAAGAGAALGKLAIDAAPLEGIRAAFDGLARSAGTSGDAVLEAMRQASAGMVSNRDLMLSFNRAAQLVSIDFAQQLPEAMQYLGKVSAATGADMDYLLNSLVVGVGRLSPMILDNLGIQVDLNDAYQLYADSVGKSVDELTKQEQQTALMNAVLERLRQNTAAMPEVAGTAQRSWAALGATWRNLKDDLGILLVPALQTVLQTVGELAEQYLPPLIDAFETHIVPIVESAATAFQTFFSGLQNGQSPLDAVRSALATLLPPETLAAFDNLVAKANEFWAAIQPVVDAVATWISDNVELQDVLIALGIAIASVVIPALAGIVEAVAPVVGAFLLALAIVAALREAWENNFLGIRTGTEAALTAIRNIIESVLAGLREFWAQWGDEISAIIDGFFAFWREIFAAFRSAFSGDWYAFGEHLRTAFEQTWENLKNVVRTALEWFRGIDWGEVGRNIVQGIANGIRNAAHWLVEAAQDAARAAWDAARGFLGIHSPSALFAEIGHQMMAGMAAGISAGVRLPEAQLHVAAGQSASAAAGSWQAVTIHHLTVQAAGADDLLRQLWALSAAGGAT